MAKKKANNKSNAASVETMPRSSSDDAASPPQSSTIQQEQKPVEAMSVEELRTELLAARAELAKSKGQAAGKLAQPQEVQELHVKLQQLRKEQQEADAARDKAWSQLKAVVQEISSLASPDYLQSLVIPRSDGGAQH